MSHEESNRGFRIRLALIYFSFLVILVGVVFRLIQLQVKTNPSLDALSKRRNKKVTEKKWYRAAILDRNGVELAVSIKGGAVFAHPKKVKRKKKTARRLSKILKLSYRDTLKKLQSERAFVWLKRQVNWKAARRISQLKLPGITAIEEKKRVYPNGSLAANIVGFTDIDGKGLAGLEFSLNKKLMKEADTRSLWKTNSNSVAEAKKDASANDGIYTTIDVRLQYVVEEEINRVRKQTKARSVMAVVLDPSSGEIFAMGQSPTYNPNRAKEYSPSLFIDKMSAHLFEPGSTLKVIFGAEAIQRGAMSPDSLIDCQKGKYLVGRRRIREAESHHSFGKIPLKDVIKYSSNIGASKLAQYLGPAKVRTALQRFGLHEKTGLALPAEANAAMKPIHTWSPLRLATVGFGQGVSFTPLQLVRAFAILANGGYYVSPRIVKYTGVEKKMRRVLTPKTANQMRLILESVVESKGGTGASAKIQGIRVAGKTGTAQKYKPGVGYRGGKYYSTFVGFLPARRPKFVIGVMIDEPEGSYYASEIAAPLFKRIGEKVIKMTDSLPNKVALQKSQNSLKEAKLQRTRLSGKGDPTVVPNLKGLSLRESLRLLSASDRRVRWSGSGYVSDQHPKPGSKLSKNTKIRLKLE